MIDLRVQRLNEDGATLPPVFVFAHEPGASAIRAHVSTDMFGDSSGIEAWVQDERRSVVAIDMRGTGSSGVIRCPALQRSGLTAGAAAVRECAASLGERARLYGVDDLVADVEAVRVALGIPRVALFGDGFGASIAIAYAREHPANVERMVLQSPRGAGPLDPLYSAGMQAVPALLTALCRRGCARIAPHPVADLTRLSSRIATSGLSADIPSAAGGRRKIAVHAFELFSLVAGGGSDPFALARFPGEVHSAVHGDPLPLLRTISGKRTRALSERPSSVRVSAGAAAAQVCDSANLPWPPGTPEALRSARAQQFVASLPTDSFGPFGSAAALGSDLVMLCSGWPSAGARQRSEKPLPDVPTLVLVGSASLLAPLAEAREIGIELPFAQVVQGQGFWENPLFEDPSLCVHGEVTDFLQGKGVEGGCGTYMSIRPVPPPPRALRQVRPVGASGRAGRTAYEVRLTVRDTFAGLLAIRRGRTFRVPGLRNGSAVFRVSRKPRRQPSTLLRLRSISYVPGVRLSGALRFESNEIRGHIRVNGPIAARGVVHVRRDVMRGKLGGRPVRLPFTDNFLFDLGVANGY